MLNHRTTIRAVFKKGVLEPLEPLDLAEGAEVEVTVDPEGLLKRFDELVREIHERNRDIPFEQVEADVDRIVHEVRREHKG